MTSFTSDRWRWRIQIGAIAFIAALLGPATPRSWATDDHGVADTHEASHALVEESASGFYGVELGEFKIRTSHVVASRKDSVSFILHANVKSDDIKTFERLFESRRNKIRDQVVVATRLVPIEDYDDPELKRFRRRILLRLHRTLPELPIEDVYVSDFALLAEDS